MFFTENSMKNISLIIVQMPLLPHLIVKYQVRVERCHRHSKTTDSENCTRNRNRVNGGHFRAETPRIMFHLSRWSITGIMPCCHTPSDYSATNNLCRLLSSADDNEPVPSTYDRELLHALGFSLQMPVVKSHQQFQDTTSVFV